MFFWLPFLFGFRLVFVYFRVFFVDWCFLVVLMFFDCFRLLLHFFLGGILCCSMLVMYVWLLWWWWWWLLLLLFVDWWFCGRGALCSLDFIRSCFSIGLCLICAEGFKVLRLRCVVCVEGGLSFVMSEVLLSFQLWI